MTLVIILIKLHFKVFVLWYRVPNSDFCRQKETYMFYFVCVTFIPLILARSEAKISCRFFFFFHRVSCDFIHWFLTQIAFGLKHSYTNNKLASFFFLSFSYFWDLRKILVRSRSLFCNSFLHIKCNGVFCGDLKFGKSK